jgi:DNA-binding NarL/FixJ family response regulator
VLLIVGSMVPATPTLADALEATGAVRVVATSADPVAAIADAADLAPDVVLVDRFVGLGDGLDVARHLHRDVPRVGIVVRTPWPLSDEHDALRAGASATVDAAAAPTALVAAIRDASNRSVFDTSRPGGAT